jgi:two-component system CheB/CheR fusion protein
VNKKVEQKGLEDLLLYLKGARGFDFTGYKRPTLSRRIQRRMQALADIQSYEEYRDYLEVHPEEFAALFNSILINVTDFFRDPDAWDSLAEHVIPAILDNKGPEAPIRVCSVGCACGKEAYTIAILLCNALGAEQFKQRAKIFGTDLDQDALQQARHATYDESAIKSVPAELRAKYFDEVAGHQFAFKPDLRRSVIFGRHDLITDAPISRLDLLICRNTLMYFNAETQARALNRFHFALNECGFLFLGRAETLMHNSDLFSPVDIKHRIFAKLPVQPSPQARWDLLPLRNDNPDQNLAQQVSIREAVLDAAPIAQLVIDPEGNVLLVNEQAREVFGLSRTDVGQPLQNLEISYRPVELRSLIDQAQSERRPITVRDVRRALSSGDTQYLDVEVAPLRDNSGKMLGVSVIFQDISAYHRLQRQLEQSNQEMETANEELQSTNEELETTNEELQSTNEELETTNEELQSTNEELETMNEELEATNEQLQTTNDELRLRTDEVARLNSFLQSILASLRVGVVVIDRRYIVLSWNKAASELWGVQPEEAQGEPLFNLDIGLPLAQLKPALKQCLERGLFEEIHLDALNRRGKSIKCRVTCGPLRSGKSDPQGVILLMEEAQ